MRDSNERASSHLKTISTSLSASGFISLSNADSAGISKASIVAKMSFYNQVMTLSLIESQR